MRQELIWAKNLTILFAILISLGCGGGGGGGTPIDPATNVTISGTVDDGTANSPIPDARCRFTDQNGVSYTARSSTNGEYSLVVPPDVEGNIRCYPSGIPNLALSNFMSTRDREAGDRISGEDVTPARTVVAGIIDSENPPVPQARKLELLDDINSGRDPDLSLVVLMSTLLYKSMLKRNIDVDFGGGGGGEGGGGGGGGAGGSAGDGGDGSPIPNARCEFIVSNDLNQGTVLQSAALADFLDDGMINRPDLDAVKDEINALYQGRQNEVKAAFAKFFPSGLGEAFVDITDADGNYFIESPPNVPGFVRCLPPNQEKLVLAAYVPGRAEGDDLTNQDVNPATTVFSTNIASKLTGDLDMTKQNFLDDIDGMEVFIREKNRDGEPILFFSLCEPDPGTEQPPDNCIPILGDTADNDVVMVAFSATTLFNSYYKNGVNGDYLAALENLTTTGSVNPSFLTDSGMPSAQADELQDNVTQDAATALGTGLGSALSTARIGVTVIDGGLIGGAEVDIPNPSSGISCDSCPARTDSNTGQVTLNLSNVPSTATEITVVVSGVPGYETAAATTQVVAFATVDLEIKMTPSFTLTVQGVGDGAGTVTNGLGDINCTIDGTNESGACSSDFVSGTQVSLTAGPTTGTTFTGWSGGGCSGAGACTVTMDQAHTVIATFTLMALPNHSLTVTKTGTGSGVVTSSPIGINCGADCSQDYTAGTSVRLTADPAAGSTFAGWSGGGCSGTGNCTVTMDQARTVQANFTPTQYTLTVTKTGTGSGVVTSSPIGINCGADCSQDYTAGTSVRLTADPAAGSTFAGWSGGGCSGTGNCTVTMDQARTVQANFMPTQYTLTVTKTGTGSGVVTSSPIGINCGADCSQDYTAGTSVRLNADPTGGSTFAGWSGGGCSGTGNCTVTMDQARTVQANFALPPIRPTISNIRQQLVSDSFTCLRADGSTFIGYYYRISVNYQDPNGDVTRAAGAKVRLDGSDFQWFGITGDGFLGTASAEPCYTSAQDGRQFSMAVVDGAGLESNSLTVTIR